MPPPYFCAYNKPCQKVNKHQSGLTLIELLVSLAIISILSFIVSPLLYNIYQTAKSDSNINQLSYLIRYTRGEALARRMRITLCPSSQGLVCENDWNTGVMIFIDENNDQQRNNEETLLQLKIPIISEGKISYNNPSNRIVFSRQGFPLGSSGSFTYCPDNRDDKYARALILSFQGRLRVGRDSNDDDVVETTGGQNVQC